MEVQLKEILAYLGDLFVMGIQEIVSQPLGLAIMSAMVTAVIYVAFLSWRDRPSRVRQKILLERLG